MSPISCIFFQVYHNFMKHCSWSVFLSLIFSFLLSFLSFPPFLSARVLFSWYFFPIRPYLFPPWGGYFPIYRPLEKVGQADLLFKMPPLWASRLRPSWSSTARRGHQLKWASWRGGGGWRTLYQLIVPARYAENVKILVSTKCRCPPRFH